MPANHPQLTHRSMQQLQGVIPYETYEVAARGPNSKKFCSTLPYAITPLIILQSTAVAHGKFNPV